MGRSLSSTDNKQPEKAVRLFLGHYYRDKIDIINDEMLSLLFNEGNYYEWINEETKYECNIIRPHLFGHWCGYVGLPQSHLFYGYNYDDVPRIEVHGGLTYSEERHKLWCLGFDCAHGGDWVPAHGRWGQDTYKNKDWVIRETNELAKQLFDLNNS